MPNNAKATSIRCAGKIVHSNVLGARATTLDAEARTITGQDADAIGATAVGVPSTTSPIRCWPKASGRWDTGFSPPSCCASRVHRGASPENWASLSLRAPAGAGGCAMRPCPMRSVVSEQGRSKPMTSITPPDTRDRPRRAGRNRWAASHGVAARNASPGGAITTKIGPRSSPG